ncbi:hypothetical protein LguiB_016741 [Lonicera macranthoides]
MAAILIVAAAGLVVFGLLVLIHMCVEQRLFEKEDEIGSQGGTNNEVPRSRGCPRLMSEDEINGLQCFDFRMEEKEEERDENSNSGGGGGGMVTAECTVCLEIYKEGEKCRVLPKCGHIFHAVCVDTWLRRNRGIARYAEHGYLNKSTVTA